MRSALLLLLAACNPTLSPDPPAPLPYAARAFSVANTHTLVVTVPVPSAAGTPAPANVVSAGRDIARVTDENGDPVPLSLPPIIDVAVGRDHACALTNAGTVMCWGDQTYGALGAQRGCIAPTTEGGLPDCTLGPEIMPNLPPAAALVAGDDVTCARLIADRSVICWGVASRTGGSVLPAISTPTPIALPGGRRLAAERLVASHGSVCAIDADAALWCWGDRFGPAPQRQPQTGVLDVALGVRHSCIIDANGLACWGDDLNGEVGDSAFARSCGDHCVLAAPRHIDLPRPATRVVVGERHTCVLDDGGTVYCFGSNEVGQLGRDDAYLVGDIAPVLDGVTSLQAGYAHTCAQRADAVWCWGSTGESDPSEEVQP